MLPESSDAEPWEQVIAAAAAIVPIDLARGIARAIEREARYVADVGGGRPDQRLLGLRLLFLQRVDGTRGVHAGQGDTVQPDDALSADAGGMTKFMFTREEAAHLLSLSVPTLKRLERDGELVPRRVRPGAVRYSREQLEAFARGEVPATSEAMA